MLRGDAGGLMRTLAKLRLQTASSNVGPWLVNHNSIVLRNNIKAKLRAAANLLRCMIQSHYGLLCALKLQCSAWLRVIQLMYLKRIQYLSFSCCIQGTGSLAARGKKQLMMWTSDKIFLHIAKAWKFFFVICTPIKMKIVLRLHILTSHDCIV